MDNTTLNSATGGDVLRDIDRNSVKTPVVVTDVGGSLREVLWDGSDPNTVLLLSLILSELQMLRQSFQDWAGQQDPRVDTTDAYNPASTQ